MYEFYHMLRRRCAYYQEILIHYILKELWHFEIRNVEGGHNKL